jgi:hypothetical protein
MNGKWVIDAKKTGSHLTAVDNPGFGLNNQIPHEFAFKNS